MDEAPWAKALEACTTNEYLARFQPFECRSFVTVMAIQRATAQVLPALKMLQREVQQEQQQQQQQANTYDNDNNRGIPTATSSSSFASSNYGGFGRNIHSGRAKASDTTTDHKKSGATDWPSVTNMQILLDMLTPATDLPTLRLLSPKMDSRVSGDMIGFFAKVALGTVLESRLAEGRRKNHATHQRENSQGGSTSIARGPEASSDRDHAKGIARSARGNPGLRQQSSMIQDGEGDILAAKRALLTSAIDDSPSLLDYCEVSFSMSGEYTNENTLECFVCCMSPKCLRAWGRDSHSRLFRRRVILRPTLIKEDVPLAFGYA